MTSGDTIRPDRDTTDVVGARIAAQVVDVVAMFVQLVAVGYLLALVVRPSDPDGVRGLVGLAAFTLPLYGGLLEGYWHGQTLGKRLVGIKVVDGMGRDPSVGKAIVRNLPAVVVFSWLTTIVALVSMAASDRRQRVFDALADTYVVRGGPSAGVAADRDAFAGPNARGRTRR